MEGHSTHVQGMWLSLQSEAHGAASEGLTDTCYPEVCDCHCETHKQC